MNFGYIKIIVAILLYTVIISLTFGNTFFSLGQNKNTAYYAPLVFTFLLFSWGIYDLFKYNPGYLKIGFAISLLVFVELLTALIEDDMDVGNLEIAKPGDVKPFDPIPYYVAIPSALLVLWGVYDVVKK
jgi:hypothetical protein